MSILILFIFIFIGIIIAFYYHNFKVRDKDEKLFTGLYDKYKQKIYLGDMIYDDYGEPFVVRLYEDKKRFYIAKYGIMSSAIIFLKQSITDKMNREFTRK